MRNDKWKVKHKKWIVSTSGCEPRIWSAAERGLLLSKKKRHRNKQSPHYWTHPWVKKALFCRIYRSSLVWSLLIAGIPVCHQQWWVEDFKHCLTFCSASVASRIITSINRMNVENIQTCSESSELWLASYTDQLLEINQPDRLRVTKALCLMSWHIEEGKYFNHLERRHWTFDVLSIFPPFSSS